MKAGLAPRQSNVAHEAPDDQMLNKGMARATPVSGHHPKTVFTLLKQSADAADLAHSDVEFPRAPRP